MGFGYFTRALYEMQASIQLIIVTAGTSLIDFFKAMLAETGAKKHKKNKKKNKEVNTQTNKQQTNKQQTNEACLNLT